MAKPKRRYICQACGSVTHRWQGQCADCGEWNTLEETIAEAALAMLTLSPDVNFLEAIVLPRDQAYLARG